jgi:hypothetical protein
MAIVGVYCKDKRKMQKKKKLQLQKPSSFSKTRNTLQA